MSFQKAIHLLYVPTLFCNMSCEYCYLGRLTEQQAEPAQVLGTLELALEKLLERGYLPFNLSFHGGEASTLPGPTLDALFQIAARHYQTYGDAIQALGFKLNPVHIKTNLLNFQKHYDIFDRHRVSISGSVDLPLSLHEKYRRDKRGRSTRERIVKNLQLLAAYPHHKKISCVVTREHLGQLDEFIDTLRWLHHDIGLDMSRFNVMFGFDAELNREKFPAKDGGTAMLNGAEQVAFYRALSAAFKGTSLEQACRDEWFKEFTPEFCCSAVNCGNKFFLLQSDGAVYSCPRGQSSPDYYYGNVLHDEVDEIIANGWKVIERNENRMQLSADCLQCAYVPHCNAGCTFVRQQAGLEKSYTCELQQAIYRDNPAQYPPLPPGERAAYRQHLLLHNNLRQLQQAHPQRETYLTPELQAEENQLAALIARDPLLRELYSESLFYLRVDGVMYPLRSAILKTARDIALLTPRSEVWLGIREDAFALACAEPLTNTLHLQMLRHTDVVYGDEQRTKQAHLFDHSLYSEAVKELARREDGYWLLDISALLLNHAGLYLDGIYNNLFITTRALRDYHYNKHKKNAFYHIQAINLPFQNLEFLFVGDEDEH